MYIKIVFLIQIHPYKTWLVNYERSSTYKGWLYVTRDLKMKTSFFEKSFMKTKIKKDGVTLFPEAGLGYLLGPI